MQQFIRLSMHLASICVSLCPEREVVSKSRENKMYTFIFSLFKSIEDRVKKTGQQIRGKL